MNEFIDYKEQLKDDRWLKLRSKILDRDHHKCTKCGCNNFLNIHHLYYVYGCKAWEYPHSALITLCNKCHEKWHNQYDVVVRCKTANKNYKPPKKERGKHRMIKELRNYSIPNKDMKLIMSVLSKVKGKTRLDYITSLQIKYKLK